VSDNNNIFPIGAAHWPASQREVEPITFEQFCSALEAREWDSKHHVNGMTILQFPRVVMICCAYNTCTAIKHIGTSIDAYFDECLEALEQVA
jgi:hypothetical protein